MPRTELTVNDLIPAALLDMESLLEAADQANGMLFYNGHGDKTFLIVKNADVSAKEITIPSTQSVGGLAVADMVISVAAAKSAIIGPFNQRTFNQPSPDFLKIAVDVDDDTSVTVGAFKLP